MPYFSHLPRKILIDIRYNTISSRKCSSSKKLYHKSSNNWEAIPSQSASNFPFLYIKFTSKYPCVWIWPLRSFLIFDTWSLITETDDVSIVEKGVSPATWHNTKASEQRRYNNSNDAVVVKGVSSCTNENRDVTKYLKFQNGIPKLLKGSILAGH